MNVMVVRSATDRFFKNTLWTQRCRAVAHTFGTSGGSLLIFSNEFQQFSPHSYYSSCHGNRVIDRSLEAHPMGALVSITVGPRFSDPRFSGTLIINFPRYRKLTVFDPDLVVTPI
eukprot:sb/3476806/